MKTIEDISLAMLLGLCIITTLSDFKEGLIRNKILIRFATIAAVLDVIYYGFIARDLFLIFVLNILVLVVIALILFYTHSFAGGDCKLVIVMALFFPANYYLMYGKSAITFFLVIGFAILYGYIYLLGTSVIKLIQKKNRMTLAYVGNYLNSFFISFFSALVYISFLNLLIIIIGNFIAVYIWFVRVVCIVVTWMVGKLEVMRKWYVVLPAVLLDVVMGLVLRTIPFSVNPGNYILAVVLLACQMTIRTNIYEEIEVGALKKGMILSMISTALMQNSRIKGMPGISSEDLRSRLTEEEVESIKRWSKSREVSTVIIVRKIPFAVFLSLGFLSYFILRVYVL